MTGSVIALVVCCCLLLLALISGLKRSFVATGHPLNLVVLRKGAENDGASALPLAVHQRIRFFDGIAKTVDGRPLVSPEMVVQPFLHGVAGGRENVLVRGVELIALDVHDQVKITTGRMFRPGTHEVILGRNLLSRYVGTELGKTIEFGRGSWDVVGIFDAGGSAFQNEIWADVRRVANDARRDPPISAIRLRANDATSFERLQARIDADPEFAIAATSETDYYAQQAEAANVWYAIVFAVALLAGTGAGFGAANTMYAAIESRIVEIGTLRALGFGRRPVMVSFLIESVALALLGFGAGAITTLGILQMVNSTSGGIPFETRTFSTNMIELSLTPTDLQIAFSIAAAIGLVAGLGPAWRAARLAPAEALRSVR